MRNLLVLFAGALLAILASVCSTQTASANQGRWVEIIEVDSLYIRQCPHTDCSFADPGRRISNDSAHTFRQRIFKGERAKVYGYEMGECVLEGNCLWFLIDEGNFIYSGYTLPLKDPPKIKYSCPSGGKCIVVDRVNQYLFAIEGSEIVLATYTTTGAWVKDKGWKTPAGTFHVGTKILLQDMIGTVAATGWDYRLNDIPYQMTYMGNLYKIHGTSTHYRFGTMAISNGCVNLIPKDAEDLYNWAEEGTPVIIGDNFSYEEQFFVDEDKVPEMT